MNILCKLCLLLVINFLSPGFFASVEQRPEARNGLRFTRTKTQSTEHEHWEYVQLNKLGDIRVPWDIKPWEPGSVFHHLQGDRVNQSKIPEYIWTHILSCVFRDCFITRTNEICLPSAKSTVLSKKTAHSNLLTLRQFTQRQYGYGLHYFVPADVLKFIGLWY